MGDIVFALIFIVIVFLIAKWLACDKDQHEPPHFPDDN